MKIATLVLLCAGLTGCDALLNFGKLRNGTGIENPDGGPDREDLAGADLAGADLAKTIPDMALGDLAGVDFALGPINADGGCRTVAGGGPYFDTTKFTDVNTGGSNDIVQIGAGDFNKDGKLDVVFSHHVPNQNMNGVDVWLNGGNRAFTAKGTPYPITCTQPPASDDGGESYPDVVTVADFDSDGNLDVVVGCGALGDDTDTGVGDLWFLKGKGDGTFVAPAKFATQVKGSFSGLAIDIDTDGHMDFVTTDYTGSDGPGITVYWGTLGTATAFTATTTTHQTTKGPAPIMVTAGLLNADTIPDLVVTDEGTASNDAFYSVVRRDRTVSHARTFVLDAKTIDPGDIQDYAYGARLARLNSDAVPDLVTIESGTTLFTTLGTTQDGVTSFGVLAPAGGANNGANANPFAFAVGDLNCDGRDEVVVGHDGVDTSSNAIDAFDVWTPNPSGVLTDIVSYSADTNASVGSVVIADFDGDYIKDVLLGVNSVQLGFVLRFVYGLGSPP